MGDGDRASGVRLAELVAALSLATDLGLGQPQEHVLRQTVIAKRLAAAAGFSSAQQDAVFYASVLAWVGCISDSHEMAKWFGDDQRIRADSYEIDKAGPSMMWFFVSRVGASSPPLRRLTTIGRFLTGGSKDAAGALVTHCETTGDIADRLGLDAGVRDALAQSFERWDGKGVPKHLAGQAINPVMRAVHISDDVEVFHRVGGIDAAVDMLRSRRGTEFDPGLVDLFCARAPQLLGDLEEIDGWDLVTHGDGALGAELSEAELTDVLQVFGDYADLKSPSWLGHSREVARLSAEAALRLGLRATDVTLTERAALVHDLGAVGVSAGVWGKPGPLSAAERERVRTHPYLTERVLSRPARLATIGSVAALHHERVDGSGYPRGLRGDGLGMPARVVAAADVYDALRQSRPHRDGVGPEEAASELRDEVGAGRLDGEAVNAVLAAAGHRVRRRPSLPAGLTPREAEVLALLARGLPNKQIAHDLSLSARTVGSHVEHVYTKIGVSSRGAAAMFAMRHGLVQANGGD